MPEHGAWRTMGSSMSSQTPDDAPQQLERPPKRSTRRHAETTILLGIEDITPKRRMLERENITTPEQLADGKVAVGCHSGSLYTASPVGQNRISSGETNPAPLPAARYGHASTVVSDAICHQSASGSYRSRC